MWGEKGKQDARGPYSVEHGSVVGGTSISMSDNTWVAGLEVSLSLQGS